MRKVLIITLGFSTLGAFINMQPASAVTKRVCNTTWFAGENTRATAQCRKEGAENYNCTTTHPIGGFAAKTTCFDVQVQPGAVSVTGSTTPGQHYKAN